MFTAIYIYLHLHLHLFSIVHLCPGQIFDFFCNIDTHANVSKYIPMSTPINISRQTSCLDISGVIQIVQCSSRNFYTRNEKVTLLHLSNKLFHKYIIHSSH